MFYYIKKETNEVKMASEKPIIYDKKIFLEKEFNDLECEGYQISYKNGILEKKEIDDGVEMKKSLKERLEKATTAEDLKDIIKDLIQ